MIADMRYAEHPPDSHVVVHLQWELGDRKAVVTAPDEVIFAMEMMDVQVRPSDELMIIPVAVSYAMFLAGMANVPLTVSGDCTVWPEDWGELTVRQTPIRLASSAH